MSYKEIRCLLKKQDDLEEEISRLQSRLSEIDEQVMDKLLSMFEESPPKFLKSGEIHDVNIYGFWDCEGSPTGRCIYVNYDEDCCVFCGDPYERK